MTTPPKPDAAPEHSRLSPSKAHTWTECTAALAFVKANEHRLPPDTPGPSAIEGTKAHTVAEYLVLGKKAPKWASKEMRSHGKAYAEFCHEAMGPKRDIVRWGAEFRAPLYYLPSERGTVDFHAITKTKIVLVDYKYGYDPVESEGNLQMAIYARSLIEAEFDGFFEPLPSDDFPIEMTIFQPRLERDHSTWTTTWGKLREFTDEHVTPKAQAILRGDPGVFKCGPKICKWCRGAAICDAYNDSMLDDFKDEVEAVVPHCNTCNDSGIVDGLVETPTGLARCPSIGETCPDCPPPKELPAPASISDDRLAFIFNNRDRLYDWLKEVEKFVNGRLLAGMKLPGVKLVLSRGGHRKWTDPAAAGKLLLGLNIPHDEIYPPEIITPAQAEKLTAKMKGPKMIELQRLIVKPPGSPMAVPENDPRTPYENDVTSDFAGVDLTEKDFWD